MDYQVSARKYRPGTFADVIGQPHIVQTLLNAISTKRIAHAYLFSGTRGVGKTTVARILAKALNCEQGPTGHPCNRCANCLEIAQGSSADVVEIDGASNTSVDDVREIRENIKFMPFRGRYRVYIIDEVHMLSNSAFNALLKTLEEPPAHVVFIFATTEIHKIPATILSRCQHYNFRRIARAELVERLRYVAQEERLTIEDRSLLALARASEGSMRDALSLLDQAVSFGGKTVRHQDLELLLGAVPHESVQGFIKAVLARNGPSALGTLASLLDQGHDLRTFCAEVVEQVRNLLVASVVPASPQLESLIDASHEDIRQLTEDAKALTPDELQGLLTIFIQTEESLRLSAHPRFVMEAAAIRAIRSLNRSADVVSSPRTSSVSAERKPPIPSESSPTSSDRSSASASSLSPASPPQTGSTAPSSRPLTTTARQSLPLQGKIHPQPPHRPRAQEAESAVSVPISPTSDDLRQLNWEAVQEEVAASFPNIAPFLEVGRYLGIKDGAVTIGFAKHNGLARTRLEKEENLRALTQLCEQQAGRPIRIRIIELADTDPPGPTMAQIRAAKEQDQRLVLFERARANPMVKQAIEIFGAELAEVRQVSKKEATE
ncbi:MAG: DNA polymerase III subunit gamma/tau [Nitrospira sp.]|nr:DNA polymerase III subunit gamma/tau [Nitrospira sp.]MCP9475192.1 DNA polymerase III subunit gamma/tau [Nitrospira sp.]